MRNARGPLVWAATASMPRAFTFMVPVCVSNAQRLAAMAADFAFQAKKNRGGCSPLGTCKGYMTKPALLTLMRRDCS